MINDVIVYNAEQKLVIVDDQRFLCDIIHQGKQAICRGENLKTGEKTEWITIEEGINAAFRFGDYIKENK